MIVHDWTKVVAGIFHDLHHRWITILSNTLNSGLLPDSYYALAEQVSGSPRPDILTLETYPEPMRRGPFPTDESGVALAEAPPKVRFTLEAEEAIYARTQNRLAIYHASDDRVVAFIGLISPGNKHSAAEVERFNHKVAHLMEAGKHFLLIDILPPGRHDPQGMHAAFWDYAYGPTQGVTTEEPFGCAAYRVTFIEEKLPEPLAYPTAYFEPFGRQGPLPTMPLFLTPERYVNVPLDETYAAAWKGVPRRWQAVIESPA